MTPSPETPPLAVDYSGRTLTEGDTVAFLTYDPVGLCEGRIRIIGPNDLCIDTGQHLVTFPAADGYGPRVPPFKPIGGKVTPRPIPDSAQQYRHVALQPQGEGGPVTIHIGNPDVGDAVRRDVAREMDRITRVQRDGA